MRAFGWIVLPVVLLAAVLIVFLGIVLMFPSNGMDFSDVGVRLVVVGGIIGIGAILSMVSLARRGRPD